MASFDSSMYWVTMLKAIFRYIDVFYSEAKIVHQTLEEHLKINLTVVDAKDRFLAELKGVKDPEQKRKTIGRIFIEVFQDAAQKIETEAANSPRAGNIEWLLQGTLYPDVIESISFKGPSQTIKSHHNVGGLPSVMKLKLIEPLSELFKDEVRVLGTKLGVPEDLVWRHPFPGPGLAVRVLEDVTEPKLEMCRLADHVFIEEIKKAGLYREISQAYASITPARAVGVQGDKRVYGFLAVLRAVSPPIPRQEIFHCLGFTTRGHGRAVAEVTCRSKLRIS